MPPSPDELLRYAAWTRRLARSLVANDALADDIAQETWLSALRRPPDTSERLEPWLRTVVRHHAFNRARENNRREAREKQIEPVEAAESSEELLARLESHKVLVDTVTRLAEPYRQMILLRYFEGLSSTEIGSREGLPPGTVRGRLKTALELLRESLDERYGSRAVWVGPIGALSHPSSTTGAVGRSSTRHPPRVQIAKWLARGATAKLASSTLIAVVATISWVTLNPAADARTPEANDPLARTAASDDPIAPPTGLVPDSERTVTPVPPPRSDTPATEPAFRLARRGTPSSIGGPAFGAWMAAAPDRKDYRCTVAVEGHDPIAEACRTGGIVEAKKLMKAMCKQAKAKGVTFTCHDCHQDVESWALQEGATDKLNRMRVLLGDLTPKSADQ